VSEFHRIVLTLAERRASFCHDWLAGQVDLREVRLAELLIGQAWGAWDRSLLAPLLRHGRLAERCREPVPHPAHARGGVDHPPRRRARAKMEDLQIGSLRVVDERVFLLDPGAALGVDMLEHIVSRPAPGVGWHGELVGEASLLLREEVERLARREESARC